MTAAATASAPGPSAKRTRWWRYLAVALVTIAVLTIAGVIAGIAFLSSQASVDFAVREMVARSEGRLEVEDAEGSMFGAIRAKRLVWRGPGATAIASDIALTWSPAALWSRRVVIHRLGAQSLSLEFKPSNTPLQLPVTLTLPLDATIEHVDVAELDYRVGKNRGRIHGLAFSYAGGAVDHRLGNLTLVSEYGTVSGDATMDAKPPYPLNSRLDVAGADDFKDVQAKIRVSGNLAAIAVEANGRVRAAPFTARTSLTPFAPVLLREFALDASDVDVATWYAKFPQTRITFTSHAQLIDGGIAGTINAHNALAGTLDSNHLPVKSLSSAFTWRDGTLTLSDLAGEFHGVGQANGRASIPLMPNASVGRWSLDLRDVDLEHIYGQLHTTRLSGAISADFEGAKPKVAGDVADRSIAGGIALAFAAVVDGRNVDVERFRARAGPGELAGRGRFAYTGERAFKVDATSRHFDPSRVGNFPAGNLIGTFAATGVLAPAWRVDASIVLNPGSQFAGAALSGTARGSVTHDAIRDAVVDLRIASAKLKAAGSADFHDRSPAERNSGNRIIVAIDAPNLAQMAPFLPAGVPRPLAGGLHARAELRGYLRQAAIDADIKGDALKLGPSFAAQALNARIAIAAAPAAASGADFASRKVAIEVDATQVVAAAGSFAAARGTIDGTLAQHTIALAIKSEDIDAAATAHGGLFETDRRDLTKVTWQGSLDAVENRGAWPMKLASPATLAVSSARVQIGEARVAIADGTLHVADFTWDNGSITTHGRFNGVPLASAARLTGTTLPFVSTVKLGGEWSLAASPRLNGTARIEREDGDIFLRNEGIGDAKTAALGITALAFNAVFRDDSMEATGAYRSMRGGVAEAHATMGAPGNARQGRIAANAPLTLRVNADLPTLQLLQPWIGAAAVIEGRARADITGRGTLEHPLLTGTVSGENLRIEAPRYGVHYHDGRLRAHLTDRRIILDELVLTAGAGEFRASGTLVAAADQQGMPSEANVTWRANKFRLFNRPDLKIVVDGDGAISTAKGKLTLSGTLRADEGRVVYVSNKESTLGDDVVVKGWQRTSKRPLRSADLPLAIDLALDFGDKLTFSGEGLDTGLRGVVHITTASSGGFAGKGSIRTVNGTYFAFSQKLSIERGHLIFDGPLDNPALDIVALRKNLQVEAGVAVTGTIKVPIIQLTSEPPVPDNEKLSWLVLGQSLDRASNADIAALQAASAVLLGKNAKPIGTRIAQSIGLDDISIKSASAAPRGTVHGTADASGQVVAVGKRLSDRLMLVYEQGLTVASNALRLEYAVSRTLTLRAEAGSVSGVGVYYRRNFD